MDTWNTLESFFLIESSNRVTRVNETNVCVCVRACMCEREKEKAMKVRKLCIRQTRADL